MSLLNRAGELVKNDWVVFEEESPAPAWRMSEKPLLYWREALEAQFIMPAVFARAQFWLKTDDDVHDFVRTIGDIHRLPLIAVRIPKFTDGRACSIATTLRRRYGYAGELRAVGDVQADQLLLLSRSHFDTFLLRANRSDATAVAVAQRALKMFSGFYQPFISTANRSNAQSIAQSNHLVGNIA